MIANKILDQYGMAHLATIEEEKQFYEAFILLTDTKIVQTFEQFMNGSDLAELKAENAELLKARSFAKTRLKKLEEVENE